MLQREIFNIMGILSTYLIAGLLFGVFMNYVQQITNNYLEKNNEEEKLTEKYNIIENIIIVLFWPIYLILFIYSYATANK
jgi:uncharacterized BrkB/YihY/UPF0761 family membrane protein